MFKRIALSGVLAGLAVFALLPPESASQDEKQAFGGAADVAFAGKVWKAMAGYEKNWKLSSGVVAGKSPHGKFVHMYSSWVEVDKRLYPVVIKDNFGGRGVNPDRVKADRGKWLRAVTVMVQRERGYDPDNHDWFWVKFGKGGTIGKNKAGVALAGRVIKDSMSGCIACHSGAKGDDYLFSNDP